LCIPRHVSERRPHYPVASFDGEVVASDANFIANDPDGVAFAILSSTMFLAWFRLVGGRIKSDLRFNKLLVYNTFPMPKMISKHRRAVLKAGTGVLDARSGYPDASLADLYDPDSMPPPLTKAHRVLDQAVDKAFNPKKRTPYGSESERQSTLLRRYAAFIADDPSLFDDE
jgi:hypothetical protein